MRAIISGARAAGADQSLMRAMTKLAMTQITMMTCIQIQIEGTPPD
jgi:hypothetical protein